MSEARKKVVYVGPFGFPEGGAAARRIYGNSVSLRKAGYDVVIVSGQLSSESPKEYNGMEVVSLDERRYEKLPVVLKHLMYFSAGRAARNWLEKETIKPAAIILYSGYSPYLIRLLPWAKKNKVSIFFDVVEWYVPPNLFSKFFSPYYLNIEFAMRFLIKKCTGIIAISKYLEEYYSKSVVEMIRVPPTICLKSYPPQLEKKSSKSVSIVFAGAPGKKDLLSTIVEAVLIVASSGKDVEFNIAGVDKSSLFQYLPESFLGNALIEKCIVCHGIVNHAASIGLVRQSDYSIIIRPPLRNVQAGFPTKFVESLAVGTPVIANITSDLGDYLENGINGLVCNGFSLEDVVSVLNSCFKVADYQPMREAAYESAKKYFDAEGFSEHFSSLIEGARVD